MEFGEMAQAFPERQIVGSGEQWNREVS
ncbi:protein of unknown function [Thiomonas sp. X19]|nr:protein of unknown function [Thiomonas sp. X19]